MSIWSLLTLATLSYWLYQTGWGWCGKTVFLVLSDFTQSSFKVVIDNIQSLNEAIHLPLFIAWPANVNIANATELTLGQYSIYKAHTVELLLRLFSHTDCCLLMKHKYYMIQTSLYNWLTNRCRTSNQPSESWQRHKHKCHFGLSKHFLIIDSQSQ